MPRVVAEGRRSINNIQRSSSLFLGKKMCIRDRAWSSFDTYCAPFIRYDHLDYQTVKQAMQEFIFNLNVPTRVGFLSLIHIFLSMEK